MNRVAITHIVPDKKTKKSYLSYIMLDEKREFTDFQIFQEYSMLNNIYVARVENIVPNIQAAFVRIAPQQMCYLSLEHLDSLLYVKKQSNRRQLSIGDEIVVQVVKDAVKTKEPVASAKLTLAGNYCMLTTENTSLGISKKITGNRTLAMNRLLENFKEEAANHGFGLIIRTNAKEVSEELLDEDIRMVIRQFLRLKEQAVHKCAFSCLYRREPAYIQKLKSLNLSTIDKILTDEEEVFRNIMEHLPYLAQKGLLERYQDEQVSLSALYNFRGLLEELTQKRVWLKSGANIIIEQLETLTVIDVNSGKNIRRGTQALLEINKEAAWEIARQLRLRNISGMILVDFVNLPTEEAQKELLAVLKQAVSQDAVLTQVIDITKLGLVELTRKKGEKSLLESLTVEG